MAIGETSYEWIGDAALEADAPKDRRGVGTSQRPFAGNRLRYGGIDRYGASLADATDEAGLPWEQLRALARHP